MIIVEVLYIPQGQLDISGSGHDALNILCNRKRTCLQQSMKSRRLFPGSRCNVRNDHFYSVSHPKTVGKSGEPPLVDLMISADSRGRASVRSGAGHNDYLPLFQRGSAPVSMTTCSLLYSVGLDIQSVSGEGCRGATQQMHFPQQDARLIPDTV